MPRYFFHIHDGADFPDTDGTELPDLQAALDEAVRLSGKVITDLGSQFWDEHHKSRWTLEIEGQGGTTLARLRFVGERLN